MESFKVYKGHNSPFLIDVTDVVGTNYTAAQMATISRVYLKYDGGASPQYEYADSDTLAHADVFDWVTYASTGRLLVDLGMLDLTANTDTTAEIVVYDTTYTDGRVLPQFELEISDEAQGDVALVDALSAVSSGFSLTVTDDYTITTDNLGGTIRLNAATDKTLTLPSVGADEDGEAVIIMRIGAGDVTVVAADSDTIGSTTATQIESGSALAAITLQYVHSITAWVVLDGRGSWSAS
jgi:hypothetical protein